MEVLFKNETIFSKNKIIKLHKYAKIHRISIKEVIKASICIFIFICSIILYIQGSKESIIYLIISIIGIVSVIKGVYVKIENWKLTFEFYEIYFDVSIDEDMTFEIKYNEIKSLIKDGNTYYIILNKCGFFLDKDTFSIGTEKEMLRFLESKGVEIEYKNQK